MLRSTPSPLVEALSGRVLTAVQKRLRPSETVRITLRGASSSALVCTEHRLLIVKIGFTTDWLSGAQIFEAPLSAVVDVVISKEGVAGHCDVITDGRSEVSKSFWDFECDHPNGRVAPNRLPLISWGDADRFRQARDTLLQLSAATRPPQATRPPHQDPVRDLSAA